MIKFEGLEEFKNALDLVAKEFPKEVKNTLNKISLETKKQLIEDSPESWYDHKNKLNKSWHKKVVEGDQGEQQAIIWSSAPHFHLINRGHAIKGKDGKVKGFKQGLFFLEKRLQKVEKDQAPQQFEKLAKKIKKKIHDNTKQG